MLNIDSNTFGQLEEINKAIKQLNGNSLSSESRSNLITQIEDKYATDHKALTNDVSQFAWVFNERFNLRASIYRISAFKRFLAHKDQILNDKLASGVFHRFNKSFSMRFVWVIHKDGVELSFGLQSSFSSVKRHSVESKLFFEAMSESFAEHKADISKLLGQGFNLRINKKKSFLSLDKYIDFLKLNEPHSSEFYLNITVEEILYDLDALEDKIVSYFLIIHPLWLSAGSYSDITEENFQSMGIGTFSLNNSFLNSSSDEQLGSNDDNAESTPLTHCHSDQDFQNDLLDIGEDVESLANLISLREVDNMAIGLFGAWGSGKSFFMKQIKSSVEKNEGRPSDLFHQGIVQIEFNTWHYMDSNLYASLASHIFQKIYDHYKEPESRESMISSLPLITDLRKELNALHTKKEKYEKELTSEKIGSSIFKAIHSDSEKLLNEVEKLAPNNKTTDKIKAVIAYKNNGKDTLAYLLKAYSKWKLIVKLIPPKTWFYFLLSTGIGAAFFFALTYFSKPANIANCAWLATLIGYAATAKSILNNEKYKSVKNLWNILTESLSKVAESRQKIATEIEEIDSKIQTINSEIDDITDGKIIQYYLAERIRSDAYNKELGIINVLRNDFEKLSLFMQTQSTEKSIGRIVLYIDDLDRCTPQKVIEVLQAVHLILSAKIFMVIVAVDIRWITKCLHQEYKISLDYEKMNEGASAYDYLEKIFQITYQVSNLSVDDNRKYIKGLFELSLRADAENEAAGAAEQGDDEQWNEQDEERFLEQLEEPDSEEDDPSTEEEREAAAYNKLTISEQELSSIIEYAGLCGTTPRTIKRFVNNYRLIKTRYYKDFEPHSTLLLLSLTTGYPLLAKAFFESIRTSLLPDATLNSVFEHLLESEHPPEGCQKVFDFIQVRSVGTYLVKDTLAAAARVRRYSIYLNDE